MGNPFSKGVDVPEEMTEQLGLQNAVAKLQIPQLARQIMQGNEFQRGDRTLDDTYMKHTLVGPENLAYKAAQNRAREMIPEGGQLSAAMGGIEQGRAQQDAAARQGAAASLLGPAPMLGGFLPSSQATTSTAGQVSSIEATNQQIQGAAWNTLGNLTGLGLAGKGQSPWSGMNTSTSGQSTGGVSGFQFSGGGGGTGPPASSSGLSSGGGASLMSMFGK